MKKSPARKTEYMKTNGASADRNADLMDYEQIPRTGLIRLLQEHDAALLDAGRDGIVMSYTGRTAPA